MTLKPRDLLTRRGDPLQLESLTGEIGLDRALPQPDIASPGLALAGYVERFVPIAEPERERQLEAAPPARAKPTGTTSTSTVVKPGRPAAPRQKSAGKTPKPLNDTTVTAVVKDAARLLSWGRDWHELPEAIARIAGRPGAQQVRQILRSSKSAIEQRIAAQDKH